MEGSNTERMDQLNDNKMVRLPTGNLHQAEGKCTEYMCGDGVSAVFTKRVWMRLEDVGIGFVEVLVWNGTFYK